MSSKGPLGEPGPIVSHYFRDLVENYAIAVRYGEMTAEEKALEELLAYDIAQQRAETKETKMNNKYEGKDNYGNLESKYLEELIEEIEKLTREQAIIELASALKLREKMSAIRKYISALRRIR